MNNITAIVLLLGSLGLFFGYINPAYGGVTGSSDLKSRSVVELRQTKSDYNDALAKARDIETALTGLLDVYNAISPDDIEKLQKLLPDHIDSVRLIIDINTIASEYGMTLKNVALSEEATRGKSSAVGPSANGFSSADLKFGLSGPYATFRSFLKGLEESLRVTDVELLGFSSGGNSELYDFSVTIATYKLE